MARIAIAGFLHETNTFAPGFTTFADFDAKAAFGGIVRAEKMLANPKFPLATGGFVKAAQEAGHDLFPILWCFAEPGGYVTADAFERILGEIVFSLVQNGPFDAVYLDLHGAMVTTEHDDAEAEILRRVRAVVGSIPVVNSLDLHGNIGPGMMEQADAMVAYRTYPHIDMRATGERAFRLVETLLATGKPLAKAIRRLPFLLPIHRQSTFTEPCKSIYEDLEAIEAADPDLASLSFLPGFPLADIPMCGATVLAYGATQAAANRAAEKLAQIVAGHEAAFEPSLKTPKDAASLALGYTGNRSILLADIQDNAGAGGTSDTVGVIEALVAAKVPDAVVAILFDPESAAKAHAAGEGKAVTLDLGGKLVPGQTPFRTEVVVEKLADGPFAMTGPMNGGLTADLGKMAQVRIGGVRVVLSSARTQCNDQDYFRHVGIEPKDHKVIVVKSSNHYRADFQPLSDQIVEIAAPGACDMNPGNLKWTKLPAGMRLYGNGPAFSGG